MAESVTCELCSEIYETDPRDPILLPCGHTFCRSCITKVKEADETACPSCSLDFNDIDVEDLPVNFQILSLSVTYTKSQQDRCVTHGDELKYWCRDCEASLCSLCLYTDHPQGHHVLLAKTFLEKKKLSLKEETLSFNNSLKEMMNEVNSNFKKCFQKMKILSQLQADVVGLITDLQKACSIKPILLLEEKLKGLQNKGLGPLSHDGTEILGAVGGAAPVCDGAAEVIQAGATLDQRVTKPGSVKNGDRGRARLDCRDGRLVVHSLTHRADHRLFLQMPSEVFLELSVGSRCLGRVYIKLWSHLRRAQQFLALCLGSMGPSHIGASFKKISDKNKERETIWCTEYYSRSGEMGYRALMLDMEWEGEYSKIPEEGLVVGYSNDINDYGFGICTKGKPGANFSGPFGEVSLGMEVVHAAVRYEPVTEVTITDCGLVIPDMTL
ncbi:tripartite motif-containing protein 6-like isoform X2 [Homarus americanus]|nr:tripartite motif-containing protein 6-like isoform X2 [Homarus americanus]XP_042231985.1 tripartite motif-containing protein 6-like isoform X2 [Homarus americanus]